MQYGVYYYNWTTTLLFYGLTESLMYVPMKDCHLNVVNISGRQSSEMMQAASQRRHLAWRKSNLLSLDTGATESQCEAHCLEIIISQKPLTSKNLTKKKKYMDNASEELKKQRLLGKLDFLMLKSCPGHTCTGGIISMTMGSVRSCTLFCFTHIMEGWLFPVCKCWFSRRNTVFEVISLSVLGLSIVLRGGRGGGGGELLKCNFHPSYPWAVFLWQL